MTVRVHAGDCLEVMAALAAEGILFDSAFIDPPYHLASIVERFGSVNAAPAVAGATGAYVRASRGFMGQEWDGGDIAFRPETWRLVYDLLKPGAHLMAFAATKNYHRMAVAIEDAGFEIRDMLGWLYGTGFPKSHDVSKGIDRVLGVERPVIGTETLTNDIRGGALLDAKAGKGREALVRNVTGPGSDEARQWEGWGSALKPAQEPICLARKPMSESSIAANVLKWGTGAINIDACRIEANEDTARANGTTALGQGSGWNRHNNRQGIGGGSPLGRWPSNILHDGSDEVRAAFPDAPGQRGNVRGDEPSGVTNTVYNPFNGRVPHEMRDDADGSAARFFYQAKADKHDRLRTKHPTVKPVSLAQWGVRLITPPGGRVLDCFAGTGTTGAAAFLEGFDCDLIERNPEYLADIERRLAFMRGEGAHSSMEKNDFTDPDVVKKANGSDLPLFS